MCGRAYETYTDDELYFRYLNSVSRRRILDLKRNYNLSPTHLSPIVLVRDGLREISLLRWGLVPSWAKDLKSAAKYSLINAKGEEIHEKRSYKDAFLRRRCIVPLSGFIEWKREGEKSKRPFAISLMDDAIMSVAGIWEHWVSKETGEIVDSFSIITTTPNSFMEGIHNRMPVILPKSREDEWLDPNNQNVDALKSLLAPCPSEWLKAHEVSVLINSPKNNVPEVLRPVGHFEGSGGHE